ncbi:ATP-binding cassette domain-containing protein [Rugosimonospora africana]|uniref:Daunorubicin resistance protein DrrA family ABC transporter ATP-binding protein n=1 Tax=Rugosimonospora africana TaxID=556532 RepID=A0A8J3VVM2_9ACTN|nr:ATP-binding cassette domain-containing protein [Rugosimonospora africana]GIH19858.1 daunorubicin resistance protein DrrA family ABC transporter ATP-binding protein [Rugosimonospora africana]
MDYAFQTSALVKRFGRTTALAGIDMAARPGTVLAVLGPNGAGKTTAIRILATLLRPDAGEAEVGGLDVVRHAAEIRRLIGLTGQYASLDEDLTGRENLVLIARLLDMPRSAVGSRADELLDRFGLTDHAARRVSTYSGGMRRRLDLAASMVGDPRIIFLDEPTTGLDPGRREDLWRIVRSLTADGRSVLLTTQYLEEADALADEVVVFDEGRVIATGTPAVLKQSVGGGQTVAVRPADPTQTGVVAKVLSAVSGREPDRSGGGVVTVAVDAGRVLTDVVLGLDAAGVDVAELSLRLPSLDEVYFALTGHHRTGDDERKAAE